MGVDGIELRGRLPGCETRAGEVEQRGHFCVDSALAQADAGLRQACVVFADIFEKGVEYGVLRRRRGEEVLGTRTLSVDTFTFFAGISTITPPSLLPLAPLPPLPPSTPPSKAHSFHGGSIDHSYRANP